MSYIDPKMVISPKARISNLDVVYNGKENGWSLAKMKWDGNDVVGMRWNGGSKDHRFPNIGNPQSRGVPTWFILPEAVANVILDMLKLQEKISS